MQVCRSEPGIELDRAAQCPAELLPRLESRATQMEQRIAKEKPYLGVLGVPLRCGAQGLDRLEETRTELRERTDQESVTRPQAVDEASRLNGVSCTLLRRVRRC